MFIILRYTIRHRSCACIYLKTKIQLLVEDIRLNYYSPVILTNNGLNNGTCNRKYRIQEIYEDMAVG